MADGLAVERHSHAADSSSPAERAQQAVRSIGSAKDCRTTSNPSIAVGRHSHAAKEAIVGNLVGNVVGNELPTCRHLPWLVGLLTVAFLSIMASAQVSAAQDDRDLLRARAELEARAAVAKLGTKVCRMLVAGIAERDWIRGVVVEVGPDRVGVRIDDPGRLAQTLNGIELKRGAVVRDAPLAWTPCV